MAIGVIASNLSSAASISSTDLVVLISGGVYQNTTVADLRVAADLANQAAQANFEDISDPVNVINKFGGRLVYDTTSERYIYANGGAAADVWNYFDETTAYTPV